MKRFLCVWCPDWPLDRLRRTRRALKTGSPKPSSGTPAEGARPFVLTEAGANGLTVAAANAAARRFGVSVGLNFSDACARAEGLASEEIDRAGDAAALKSLAAWMTRWTPLVALDGIDGLMLETTGCAHLFGGEAALLRQIARHLEDGGVRARLALAGTPGAAWALAHVGEDGTALSPGAERDALADLTVSGLRLSDQALILLRRFGLTRIGQLYDIDRRALARRFQSSEAADAVLLRLDQALGARLEPLEPLRSPPDYAARLSCPEPLGHTDGVRAGLARLMDKLAASLAAHGTGARAFAFTAYRSDGTVSRVKATASRPAREAEHVLRLFQEKIDRVDPGFGIDLLTLEARRAESLASEARPLSADLTGQSIDLAGLGALADRVNAKLGDSAARVLEPHESHIPEQAERRVPFDGRLVDWTAARAAPRGPRPLRLFDRPEAVDVLAEVPDGPPQRLVWRKVARRVRRAEGPERIAPDWWRAPIGQSAETAPRARDYYRIEDEAGRRYWVFREGLYEDGRGGPPRWFVHGLFP